MKVLVRKSRFWPALILLTLAAPSPAQRLTLGVVAGTSLTGDFESGTTGFSSGGTLPDGQTTSFASTITGGSRGLIIGPKLQLKLPWNLSLEVDALHRALHSTTRFTELYSGGTQIVFTPPAQTHASWEFPVLVRYRFERLPFLPLRPFVEGGPSLRPAGTNQNVSHWGATAGGGVELRVRSFNISPGIRFTRWKSVPGSDFSPAAIQNQVEFLVAFDQSTGDGNWAAVFGKRFSAGVLGGIGVGDDLHPSADFSAAERPDSNSPIVGLLLEFALPHSLFLEVNGIYRPLHVRNPETGAHDAVLTWEFPVMAKYKLGRDRRWRPFAELGPSFRLDGNPNGPKPSHYGAAAGAGLEFRFGKLKLSPAVRYTRWGKDLTSGGGGVPRNEVATLVGLAF